MVEKENLNAVPKPRKRAVIYLRVSKDSDEDNPKFAKVSPETQEEKCRGKVKAEKWEQGPIFGDVDVPSSDWERRKGWQACLLELQPGDVLVAYEQTRIARLTRDWVNLYQDWKERNIELCCLNLSIDTTTPEGEHMMRIFWSQSEYEIEVLKRRIRDGKDRSRRMGRSQGGPPVLGLRSRPDKGKGVLEIVEKEAQWVRTIFQMRASGHSLNEIASHLRENGVTGPGKNKITKEPGVISSSSVARILRNEIYIGWGHYAKKRYAVDVEPMIPMDLWERAQAVQKERASNGPPRGRYILSGLMRCSKCGATLVRWKRSENSGQRGRVEWACGAARNYQSPYYHGKRCTGVFITEHLIEKHVMNLFWEHLDERQLADEMAQERQRKTIDRSEVEVLKRRVQVAQERQDKLLAAYADGLIGKRELGRQNDRFLEEIASLEEQIQLAEIKLNRSKQRVESLETEPLRDAWDKLHLAERRRVLSLFIDRIVVYPGRNLSRVKVIWSA